MFSPSLDRITPVQACPPRVTVAPLLKLDPARFTIWANDGAPKLGLIGAVVLNRGGGSILNTGLIPLVDCPSVFEVLMVTTPGAIAGNGQVILEDDVNRIGVHSVVPEDVTKNRRVPAEKFCPAKERVGTVVGKVAGPWVGEIDVTDGGESARNPPARVAFCPSPLVTTTSIFPVGRLGGVVQPIDPSGLFVTPLQARPPIFTVAPLKPLPAKVTAVPPMVAGP